MSQWSAIRNVTTVTFDESRVVKELRNYLGLNHTFFTDMDNDLILLAFIPSCYPEKRYLKPETRDRLEYKYGTCSHQSLEFYGDRILYDVITSIMYELLGLKNTPKFLSSMMSYLTSNRILTDLMLNKNACQYVRTGNYAIRSADQPFHNICADTFEALIGALFVHLNNKKISHVEPIKDWLLENTNIPFFLKRYLLEIGSNNELVYTMSDKQALVRKAAERRMTLLEDLKELRGEIGEEIYNTLYSTIVESSPDINDFSSRSIVVEEKETLSQVFTKLSWMYHPPTYYPELESYQMFGYPNGRIKTIGSGLTEQEAESDAYKYLIDMGYIVLYRKIKGVFA